MAWKRLGVKIVSFICMLWLAGAGANPALASLCNPILHSDVYGRGDALIAYAPLLELRNSNSASEHLSLMDNKILKNVREYAREKDVYVVDWHGELEAGCSWGREKETHVSVKRYQRLGGIFSFTEGFLAFADGIDRDNPGFTMTNYIDNRTGIKLEAAGIPLPFVGTTPLGHITGGFFVDQWELHEFVGMSLVFQQIENSSKIRITETNIRRARSGEILPANAVPFKGGGWRLGAQLTWSPVPSVGITYEVDGLYGNEWAKGLIYESMVVQNHQQYIGIDGYLENRPLGKGFKRNHEFSQRPLQVHRIRALTDLDKPLHLGLVYYPFDHFVESVTIGMRHPLSSGHVQMGVDFVDGSMGGALHLPLRIGPVTLTTNVGFRADHLFPHQMSLIHFRGGAVMLF